LSSDDRLRIPSLDGIRGLAALLVFISHGGFRELIPCGGGGGFGVSIFFLLSGYLITTLLRQEFAQTGAIDLKAFYIRRAYRILPPLYIVLLFVMLPFVNVADRPIHSSAVVTQFLQLSNYYEIFAGPKAMIPATSPMWSLAVEEHFYLLFPLGLLLLLRRTTLTKAAGVLMGVCVVVLLWRLFLISGGYNDRHYTYYATDTRVDSLLYGCIMALCLNPMLDRWTLEIRRAVWIALLALSAVVLLFTFVYPPDWFHENFRFTAQAIALIPWFFCAVRYSTWPIFSWLNSRLMRAMGLISYTFYLIHEAAIEFAAHYFKPHLWLTMLVGLLLAVGFSTLMYVLLERRLAALRRRLHSKRVRAGRAATATA
jgi:peptidoglycan/LPS O-acetylase OafA/YrhL